MEICTAYATDIGISKEINQDGLLIKIAQTVKGKAALLAVCDGMGGLSYGEKASTHVILKLAQWFDQQLPEILPLEEEPFEEELEKELRNIIQVSNKELSAYGNSTGTSLGTTCTAMLVFENKYFLIHVGDTRAYEIMDTIVQITKDQTVLAREIELGRISSQDAKNDARGSVLLQCIGASKVVEPEFVKRRTCPGMIYLICSDGFRHKITDFEILDSFRPKYMLSERAMKKQCEYMIDVNKTRQEKDNISVVVAKIN